MSAEDDHDLTIRPYVDAENGELGYGWTCRDCCHSAEQLAPTSKDAMLDHYAWIAYVERYHAAAAERPAPSWPRP
jgi:hypothetical protein